MRIRDSLIVPTFDLEAAEMALAPGAVAGVDEAGRGPWAGPVVAAAVVLDPANIPAGLADSKQLDEAARETAFASIRATSDIGVGIADVARIDRDNILAATMWAMAEAVARLRTPPRLAIVDGNRVPRLACAARAIVKGDAKCLSISAASIVAKVTRDRLMCEMARQYPGYGFERHKGYGTPAHRDALARLGVSAIHRRSFRPVQLALSLLRTDEAVTG
ncbi:MAG: ribonuclease HII [Hyphomicrobiaceae bacterium]|nr:ribonuclease HII [Hyphomicrobiaceae bacterium]